MNVRLVYRERHFIDKYRCYDVHHNLTLYNVWRVGGIMYGYTDPHCKFTLRCISNDDIVEMVEFNPA